MLKKYSSENEIETFQFHDCIIKDINTLGDNVIWSLNHIDVKVTNKFNSFNKAMQTDEAIMTFYNARYVTAKKHFGIVDGIEKIESVLINGYNSINQLLRQLPDKPVNCHLPLEGGKGTFFNGFIYHVTNAFKIRGDFNIRES